MSGGAHKRSALIPPVEETVLEPSPYPIRTLLKPFVFTVGVRVRGARSYPALCQCSGEVLCPAWAPSEQEWVRVRSRRLHTAGLVDSIFRMNLIIAFRCWPAYLSNREEIMGFQFATVFEVILIKYFEFCLGICCWKQASGCSKVNKMENSKMFLAPSRFYCVRCIFCWL